MRLDALIPLPTDPDHVLTALVVPTGDDIRYASLQIGQSAPDLQVGDGHEGEAVARHCRRAGLAGLVFDLLRGSPELKCVDERSENER
jgi:hypothetical protein